MIATVVIIARLRAYASAPGMREKKGTRSSAIATPPYAPDTKISEKKGKLELSLEPERLGKLTIRLEYEKGKTEVTIFSTSAKTLEILSKEAGHLAQILEEKTGTPTVIYTPEQTENRQNMDQDPGHGRNGRQDQKEQRQKQDDSFAQQLRLGLA